VFLVVLVPQWDKNAQYYAVIPKMWDLAMKKGEFRAALEALGYDQKRFAQLFDIPSSTIGNWVTGGVRAPSHMVALVEYLHARPEAKVWFEERRPVVEKKVRPRNGGREV
jgi:DNA-binding transcriptional regulator YiaG